MKIISDKNKLVKFIQSEKNLGFVPTMGAIHHGHISLIRKSVNQCDKTIISIFINIHCKCLLYSIILLYFYKCYK